MADATTKLAVNSRAAEGSRAARRLRRSGRVPGVLYGGGGESVSFDADARDLRLALAGSGAVLDLSVDGETATPVVLKEASRDPVRGETVHVDNVVTEIERACPSARGTITCAAEPLAIPAEMDDTAIREALGPLPATALADGVGSTIARFAELRSEGRLDTSELDA